MPKIVFLLHNYERRAMKKTLVTIAMVIFVSVFFTTSIFAAANFGKVTDISAKDSATITGEVKIDGNETDNVTITYDATTLKILEGTGPENGNRPAGYAWLGFNITKPDSVSPKQGNAKYRVNNSEPEDYTDGNYYFGINKDKLIQAVTNSKNIEYTYEFDWDNDGDYDQTVTAVVQPSKITLNATEGNTLWTPADVANYAPAEAPKTGDSFPIALFGILSLLVVSGVYSVKFARQN